MELESARVRARLTDPGFGNAVAILLEVDSQLLKLSAGRPVVDWDASEVGVAGARIVECAQAVMNRMHALGWPDPD